MSLTPFGSEVGPYGDDWVNEVYSRGGRWMGDQFDEWRRSRGSSSTRFSLLFQQPGGVPPLSPKKRKMDIDREIDDQNPDKIEQPVSKWVGRREHGVLERRSRMPRVSRRFKKLVQSAMATDMVNGYKRDIFSYTGPSVAAGQQGVDAFVAGNSQAAYNQWSFLPDYFLDAASVLWNGKALNTNGYQINTVGTIGQANATTPGSVGNNVQFLVRNSWEKWTFKNNTARSCTLKLFECAPKRPSFLANNVYDQVTNAYIGGIAGDALVNPPSVWKRGLDIDVANGILISNNQGQNNLYMDPRSNDEFNKQFNCDCKEIVLDPGTSFEYRMQGPSDFEFKVQDHFLENPANGANLWYDIQKYSRYVMIVQYWDLAINSVGTNVSGRVGFTASQAAGNALVWERHMWCSLQMPPETGIGAVAGSVVARRHKAYVHTNWGAGSGTNTGPVIVTEKNTGQQMSNS